MPHLPIQDPYDKLLDEMIERTLQGEIIPFDEWIDAMDDLDEEPEVQPTEAEVEEAMKARETFLMRLQANALPAEDRFLLCQLLNERAKNNPTQELLRILCYVVCDTGVLLDVDRDCRTIEQDALCWPDIRREAEKLYAQLTVRQQQIKRFRSIIAEAKQLDCIRPAPAAEDEENLRQIYDAYCRIFSIKGINSILKDNIAWLLQLAGNDTVLRQIKPLFLFKTMTKHKKRLEKETSFRLDFQTLWKRRVYAIEDDNGKNFQSYVKALSLFESLYEILGSDRDVDVPLCMAGFDCLSNLGDFYRMYPNNRKVLPLLPSVDDLFETLVFSCFEHGYCDNLMLEVSGISVTRFSRFLTGRLGHHLTALRQLSGSMARRSERLAEQFLAVQRMEDEEEKLQQLRSLCQSILEQAGLKGGPFTWTKQEEALFFASVNNILMEMVDEQAEKYLINAAKRLCGEESIEDKP